MASKSPKGNAYVVRGISDHCTTNVSILDNNGKKLASAPCKPSYTTAFEYIPNYTGLFYVEYADNFRYRYYSTYYLHRMCLMTALEV